MNKRNNTVTTPKTGDKLWDGRFSTPTATSTNDYNSSLSFDSRMYKEDILGSIAHCKMLVCQQIIPTADGMAILDGLESILQDIESQKLCFEGSSAEDIHMFIEEELTNRIGQSGKMLHTGRSRNDQVALDLKLYLKNQTQLLTSKIKKLYEVLLNQAQNHTTTIMPGYTHLQRAQPISFAFHLLAYIQMFQRDLSRLSQWEERVNTSPLGAGALAGTTYPLDRQMVAQTLGMRDITENALDSVSDRDYVIELAGILAIFMMHLSRLSEEIILWSSQEFNFIQIDDAFSTGSSIMPQKKNPDVAELTRGKTGRVYGNLISLLVMMKGLPLAYNKDMQEDKEAIFDSIDTLNQCLIPFTGMMQTLTINKKAMAAAAAGGFTNATDLADYLVKKDLPFRTAHHITGQLVKYCIDHQLTLQDLPLAVYHQYSDLFASDLYMAIDPVECLMKRKNPGSPAPETVKLSILKARKFLEDNF